MKKSASTLSQSNPNKSESNISKIQVQQQQTNPLITLNGVLQAKATQMIENFRVRFTNDTNTQKSVSAWYSQKDIIAINNLLAEEYKNGPIKPDGVRIYFGCNDPASGTGSKLKPDIFLVSTTLRDPIDLNKSDHVDYYDHLAGYLPSGETGRAIDDDADNTDGALLYGSSVPTDIPCTKPGNHYMNAKDAFNAVQRHRESSASNDLSAYNTRSEWFELCFMTSVFNAIINPINLLNGLRIYFGKRIMTEGPDRGKDRDVFVLVPTNDVGGIPTDSYKCLEDLSSVSCNFDWTKALTGDKDLDAHITFMKVAGYDRGELCPFSCN